MTALQIIKAALEFYADDNNTNHDGVYGVPGYWGRHHECVHPEWDWDRGGRAQEALKALALIEEAAAHESLLQKATDIVKDVTTK